MSKPRLLRFYLLCLAALVLACAWPEWAVFLPPLLFFPGQSGCFCCAADCQGCVSGTASGQLQIDIDSINNNSCGNCTAYNGTWVASRVSHATACLWEYEDTTIDICGASSLDGMKVSASTSGVGTITLFVAASRPGTLVPILYSDSETFANTYGSNRDCSAFSAEAVAHLAHGGPGPDCSGTPTCEVTSL
jgi:hypothetical protein